MGHPDSKAPSARVAAGRVVNSGGGGARGGGRELRHEHGDHPGGAAVRRRALARCALRCSCQGTADGEEASGGASCGGEETEDVCAICVGELADDEKVRVQPRCGHGFHVRCVDAWLVSHGSCLTCRRPVMNAAPAKGSDVGRSQRPDNDTIAVVIA